MNSTTGTRRKCFVGMEKSRMSERLLTTAEVCRRLGVCIKTLQVLRNRRKIAYIRFGHRSIRFREHAVEDFIQRREKAVNFAEGRNA